jgi:hypothetical protein
MIANNHLIVANSGESQHQCPSRRSPSSPQNPTRGGSRRSNPRPQLVVTATSCWRFVHLVVNACSDFPSRCDNIKPRAGDGAGDGNRTRVLNLGISHRCESSVIEDGGLVRLDPTTWVGLAVPVSIFGVIEHEQISVSAQGRAASVSDTTLAHALHHMVDSSTLFSFAPLVFIVGFVRRATVWPPSTTGRSRDHYLRSRRRIVLNRTIDARRRLVRGPRRFALAQRKSESSSTRSLSAATIRASRAAKPTNTASRSWGG